VVIKTDRSDKTEIKMSQKYSRYSGSWLKVLLSKILFKNQRPPAEVAPAPFRGHPHTLALLVVADSVVKK